MGAAKARVEIELEDLNNKIEKLYKFSKTTNFEKLPTVQQALLTSQHSIMLSYAEILSLRLQHWEEVK